MLSFDVESLFTNVPLDETIKLASEYVYSDTSVKTPPFPKDTFVKLLKIATGGIFMFKERFFKQIDGVTMGSPLGPTMANLFLAHHENTWMSNSKNIVPRLYLCYVDDIFCVFSQNVNHESFFDILNKSHANIKFTVEIGNDLLPFLDTKIHIDKCSFESFVYRKQTNTNLLLNFNSKCPIQWKIGLIHCFLRRAYNICSNWSLFHVKLQHLKKYV